jgi:hypothetical protein
MQKKTTKSETTKVLLVLEIKNHLRSFVPIIRNGWGIKFSTYRDTNILLTIVSIHTGQTIIRYFTDEDGAVEYINYIIAQNPSEILKSQ